MRIANVEEFFTSSDKKKPEREKREENKLCWYHVCGYNLVQQCSEPQAKAKTKILSKKIIKSKSGNVDDFLACEKIWIVQHKMNAWKNLFELRLKKHTNSSVATEKVFMNHCRLI